MTIADGVYKVCEYLLGLVTDSGWITLPLAEGITAYNEANIPEFRKVGKIVFLRGTVKGVTARNTVIGNLPEGYRPNKAHPYPQNTSSITGGIATMSRMVVTTTGDIQVQGITEGASYGADKWFPIATSFLVD